MSNILYNKWKNDDTLPLECLINTIFIYKEYRDIVQFDTTYYESRKVRNKIAEFVDSLNNIIKREDSSGNIIVYLQKKQEEIENKLRRIGKGSIDGAFRTSKFADMLEPVFYTLKGRWPSIFQKKRDYSSFNQCHTSIRSNRSSAYTNVEPSYSSKNSSSVQFLHQSFKTS